jgi:hypothetical protein
MTSQLPIPTILSYQQIAQYLSTIKRNTLNQTRSGSLIDRLPELLYMEGDLLLNLHTLNPGSPTERPTEEYVLELCSGYTNEAQNTLNGIAAGPPVVTGPSNQSGNVGFTAVFSVAVTGPGPFSYQWLQNGIVIPGATASSYSKANAQLSDSGENFSVQVTNANSTVTSASATLTVTASISGFLYYNAADPGPTLITNADPFVYQESYSIVHNASISAPIPSAATPNLYLVFKIPSSEPAKTIWTNGAFNFGNFPDSVFQTPLTFGGFAYYYTRVSATMDSTQNFVMS